MLGFLSGFCGPNSGVNVCRVLPAEPSPTLCLYFEGVLFNVLGPCPEAQTVDVSFCSAPSLDLLGHRGNPGFVCWFLGHWCVSPGLAFHYEMFFPALQSASGHLMDLGEVKQ